MASSPGSVQSVERVLDIAEALAAVPQGMSLSDLSAVTGLHISTTHRLIGVLADRGYACKDLESGKYRLTLRMFEMGSRVSSVLSVLSLTKPLLDDLASVAQEVIHLVEQDGTDVVYMYKAEPASLLVQMSSYVGCRNPLYCTGVGKCILAYLPEDEVKRIWEKTDVRKLTENTVTDFDQLSAQLEQIRAEGYALDNEEHVQGVRCIAAPIFDWTGRPKAAVSISAPVFRASVEALKQHLPRLKQLTQEASQLLGYSNLK